MIPQPPTAPIQIRKSEFHQNTKGRNFWADLPLEEEDQDQDQPKETPEPFGFNVGFPAIWRVVAGNKIGKSLSADVKHYL